jgi:hypothetical protein
MTDVRARTTTGARTGLHYLVYGFGLLLALLSASCGNTIFQVGTPVITLTAKPGRFASYIVTIDAIELTRQDGAVATLPVQSQRVDLANLSAYANLLAAPALEIGTYVSATFVLDYSFPQPADVRVKANGGVFPATLYDGATQTAPVTETMVVQFDPDHPFVVNDQQSAVMAIDIDLEASNIINAGNAGVFQVTVKPFWNVTAQPTYDKQVFARGLYVLADVKNNNFVMNVRPLHDVVNTPFGALKVNVNDQTYYNVNGVVYTGAAGLAAVSTLQNVYADLQIAAYGPPSGNPFSDLSTITPAFTATQVYVGQSFESTIEDQLTGFVSGISGDVLTVRGAAFVDRLGDFGFAESVPVTVGPNTNYSIDGVANVTPNLSSISVGQVITVLGLSSNNGVKVDPTALDATGALVPGAQVRIQNTPLLASLGSAASASTATVNLLSIDHYEPTLVDFTGTGSPIATPANYVITTPTDLTGTAPGTVLDINGTTTAFGQGPPYFTASSVTADTQQELIIEWAGSGSPNPFSVVNQNGIAVNLADSALTTTSSATVGTPTGRAVIVQGPQQEYDLLHTNQPPNPTQLIVQFNTADAQHPPMFGVGSVAVGSYMDTTNTADFADRTQIVSNGTLPIMKLAAYGQYDPTSGTFSATRITINAQ